MAVVTNPDELDLVVQPHELTPEDHELYRKAIEENRRRYNTKEMTEKALRMIEERRRAAQPAEGQV